MTNLLPKMSNNVKFPTLDQQQNRIILEEACKNVDINAVKDMINSPSFCKSAKLTVKKDVLDVCSKSGNIHIIECVIEHVMKNYSIKKNVALFAFQFACKYGHLDIAKWIVQKYELYYNDAIANYNDALYFACKNGHLDIIQWFVPKFFLTSVRKRKYHVYVFGLACKYGHFELVQWAFQHIRKEDVKCGDNYAFRNACCNGHMEIVKWLVEQVGDINYDANTNDLMNHYSIENSGRNWAFNQACEQGILPIVEWLFQRTNLTLEDLRNDANFALKRACYRGHIHVVQWLMNNFPLDSDDCSCAILSLCQFSHLNILQLFIQRFQMHMETKAKMRFYWNELIKNACKQQNSFMVLWSITNFPDEKIPCDCENFVQKVKDENENDVMIKPAPKRARVDIED